MSNSNSTIDYNNIRVELKDLELITPSNNAVKKLYHEIKKYLNGGKITQSNVIAVLVNLMKLIEEFPDLSGVQKKHVVIQAICVAVDDQREDVEEATRIKEFVVLTLPDVIDTIVDIDKRKLKIKIKKIINKIKNYCCC